MCHDPFASLLTDYVGCMGKAPVVTANMHCLSALPYAELHIMRGTCSHQQHSTVTGGHLERLFECLDLVSQLFALLCLVMRFFHKRTQLSSSCQGLFGSAPFLQIYHIPALLDHAVWLI